MSGDVPTKREIGEYLQRTKDAARSITFIMGHEKHFRGQGPHLVSDPWTDDDFADRLTTLAEELSGCASEVQTLLAARYGYWLAGNKIPNVR